MLSSATHERFSRIVLILAWTFCLMPAGAVEISNRYRSPRNPERKVRPGTELIVLHTTEAPAKSSLNKVSERGECHFCVTEEGTVYRIVDRDKEAFHAGRSMWNGKEDMDKYTIGIECVGYHDKPMSLIQLYAIRDLVAELKAMYRLSDEKVVTHSQVAYGAPNKWQKKRHRGRKRCGMLFAMPSVRRILGLKSRMAYDPDTKAKRLTVGDPYLEKILYGCEDTMKSTYGNATVAAAAPSATSGSILDWLRRAAAPTRAQPTPAPTPTPKRVATAPAVSTPKPTVKTPARSVAKAKPTAVRREPRSISDLTAQGYKPRGTVVRGRTASQIAGSRWNSATTYYTIRNKVIPGNAINPAKIEVGMCIWMK